MGIKEMINSGIVISSYPKLQELLEEGHIGPPEIDCAVETPNLEHDLMNTGLSLRKTRETSYGQFRRFVIANSIFEPNRLHNCSYKSVAKNERRFCERFQIEYLDPVNTNTPSKGNALRACDYCLKTGYHSEYFNFDWLDYCPVHNRKLSNICSECGQPWPTKFEMLQRDCRTCGRTSKLSELKALGAFNTQLHNNKIHPLIVLEEFYKSSTFGDLYCSFGSNETSNWHRSNTLYSDKLPSNLVCLFPHTKSLFNQLRVYHFEPCQLTTFNISKQPLSLDWTKALEIIVDSNVTKVSKIICRKLCIISNNFELADRIIHIKESCELRKFLSIESIAYAVWRILIDPKLKNAYKQQALRNIYSGYHHLVPTPMNVYGPQGKANDSTYNATYSYFNPWVSEPSIKYPPLSLIELVYKIDLITCFKEIYKYLLDQLTSKNPFNGYNSFEQKCYGGNVLMRLNPAEQRFELSVPKSLMTIC